MYTYSLPEWLMFFYIYCVVGWIFESTYVSLLQKRFVNRGFLRIPMLPLYGSGAIMMLWVSIPVRENLVLTFFAGMIGATILEYVVGISMEAIFKVKYWDYSNQKFNFQGVICLSSSIAWGVLTILLTRVIHKPIESWVLGLPDWLLYVLTGVISVIFIMDTVESVRAALDLSKVLTKMTEKKQELDALRERLDLQLALGKMEVRDHLEERYNEQLNEYQELKRRLGYYKTSLLKAHPRATSKRFGEALVELHQYVEEKKQNVKEKLENRI